MELLLTMALKYYVFKRKWKPLVEVCHVTGSKVNKPSVPSIRFGENVLAIPKHRAEQQEGKRRRPDKPVFDIGGKQFLEGRSF